MLFTVDSAKQFLLSKISEEARHDGIGLDEIEKRMFVFSESSGLPDFEANEKFEKSYDASAYETKIAGLLRKAYADDQRSSDRKAEWKAALDALRKEDFYGLVMVDDARIPRANDALWSFVWQMLPFAMCEFVILVAGWFLIFAPSRLGLYLPDWCRLLLMPAFLWVFWYVGKIFGRVQTTKRAQRLS
jgi:hypothetical protein